MPAVLIAMATPALFALDPLLPPNLIWLGYLIPHRMEDPRDVVALLPFLLAGFGSALLITNLGQANHRELKSASTVQTLILDFSDRD